MKLFIFFLLSIFTQFTFAQELDKKIESLLKKQTSNYSFSLRAHDGTELINLNGQKLLSPASIAKTISTGCSLDILGPHFQFTTEFGYRGKIVGDTLKGDLIVHGGGDPSLVIEDLREIVEKIRYVHGIKKIEGNLIFDVSYLGVKSLKMAEGFEGDNGRSFAAELTAAPMNQNSFSFWVVADHRNDKETRSVTLPAQVVDVKVSNKTKVGKVNNISVSYDADDKKAVLSGTIPADAEPKGIYRSVPDAYDYATDLMIRLWRESGGEWAGNKTQIETSKIKSTLLWRHQSKPLSKILMDINKLSLNMGAEMTLMAAGAEKKGLPANYEKGLAVIKECLTKFKISSEDLKLTNASGLSRQTEIKTSALTQFLWNMHRSSFSPEYLSSFSIVGIDGTTKSRLKEFATKARLKTGSIRGVRSIAGYLYNQQGQSMSFALIMNGVDGTSADAKSTEDQIIEMILKKY
jgi:D-alanyl-D-alanine carboxypeptidase/D-alanyl-D-alanine-endopeptidase (penicillin-binding protein 4)